jgi:hypothetical protein
MVDTNGFKAPTFRFLIEYRRLIEYVAVSGWVRFIAPKLEDKSWNGVVAAGTNSATCGELGWATA